MNKNRERYLLFIRHGETDLNKKKKVGGLIDVPLNKYGKEQAKCCASAVEQIITQSALNIKKIYSSGQSRAFETAVILSQDLGIPVCPKRGLNEIDFGLCEGLIWEEEVKLIFPDFWKQYKTNRSNIVFPGGASMKAVFRRVEKTLKTILDDEGDDDVLIVCHSGIITIGIVLLCGFPFQTIDRFSGIKNTVIVPLKMTDGRWTLWLGLEPHLVILEGYNIRT